MILKVYTNFSPFASFDELLSGTPEQASDIIVQEMTNLMKQPKSGNLYKHSDGSIRPASAPGEAPGIDTGAFSEGFDVVSLSMMEAQINNSVEYGFILEDRKDRPFTEAGIDAAMPRIVDLIEGEIEDGWR